MKDKTQTITFGAICLFLVCYFMRLFNFPNELIVILGAALCMVLVVQQKKIRIDAGICLLTFTMLFYYVIINGAKGLMYSITYIPMILYILGNYAACSTDGQDKKYEKILILIYMFILGYALHGILNAYMYYAGYGNPGTRRWQDFWTRGIVPGTQHAAYFLPTFVAFFPALIYFKEKKTVNILVILTTVFFGYTSLVIRSRGALVNFAIFLMVQVIIYACFEKEKVKKGLSDGKHWVIAIGIAIVVAVVAFLVKDSEVIVIFIQNMSKGGGIINNVRFQTQRMVIEQLFNYPMGGSLMELGGISHAHNVWLDMANIAGLIPFCAFSMYTFFTLYELIKFIKNKNFSVKMKLLIAGMYVAFFMYFTIETALEASVHLTTPWFFINGLTHGMLRLEKKKEKMNG